MVLDFEDGYLYKLSDFKGDLSSDHAFPQSEIKKIKGYEFLNKDEKKEIKNYKDNIIYMTISQNASKNNKTVVKANDEKIYPGFTTVKGKDINEHTKKFMDYLQKNSKSNIIESINELNNKKGIYEK